MAPTLPKPTRGNNASSSSSSSSRPNSPSSSSNPGHEFASMSSSTSDSDDPIAMSSSTSDDPISMSSSDEDDEGNQAAHPIALSSSTSSSDDDEEDDEDDGSHGKRAPVPRNRKQVWLFRDEIAILTALATKRRESGQRPDDFSALRDALAGELHRENLTTPDLSKKIFNLRNKFRVAINSGGPGRDIRNQKLYELSVEVWPEELRQ